MSYIDRLRAFTAFDPADYLPFRVDGQTVGLVRPEFAHRLAPLTNAFVVTADAVVLAPSLAGVEARTRAVDEALRPLAAEGVFRGWRDEPYRVAADVEDPPLFLMERAAIPRFGIRASGIHVNGFVRDGDALSMWIGRRSPGKHTAPNKLDQIVAGGRSASYSVRETLLKESEEEAGIEAAMAARSRPAGAITYISERREGLRRDVLYVFDLELPASFVPVNQDGEIAEFQLWPIARVMAAARDTDDFKFNCALVVIDFLIRHGLISPDNEPDYLRLVRSLHAE